MAAVVVAVCRRVRRARKDARVATLEAGEVESEAPLVLLGPRLVLRRERRLDVGAAQRAGGVLVHPRPNARAVEAVLAVKGHGATAGRGIERVQTDRAHALVELVAVELLLHSLQVPLRLARTTRGAAARCRVEEVRHRHQQAAEEEAEDHGQDRQQIDGRDSAEYEGAAQVTPRGRRSRDLLSGQHVVDLKDGLQDGLVVVSVSQERLHVVHNSGRQMVCEYLLAGLGGLHVCVAVPEAQEQQHAVVAAGIAHPPAVADLLREALRRLLLAATHPVVRVHVPNQRDAHLEAALAAVRALDAGARADRRQDVCHLLAGVGAQDVIRVAQGAWLREPARARILERVRHFAKTPTLSGLALALLQLRLAAEPDTRRRPDIPQQVGDAQREARRAQEARDTSLRHEGAESRNGAVCAGGHDVLTTPCP
mmetsp:Transcript_58496/g.171104  ORF Transcript_58496/g.171104 Transcript_58496/m.171104 type:complete len:425 (+) Transcript_58496:480-1754(+)